MTDLLAHLAATGELDRPAGWPGPSRGALTGVDEVYALERRYSDHTARNGTT